MKATSCTRIGLCIAASLWVKQLPSILKPTGRPWVKEARPLPCGIKMPRAHWLAQGITCPDSLMVLTRTTRLWSWDQHVYRQEAFLVEAAKYPQSVVVQDHAAGTVAGALDMVMRAL